MSRPWRHVLAFRNGCRNRVVDRLRRISVPLVVSVVGLPAIAFAQEALLPGQAFVTQFSGTATETGSDGTPRTVIDVNGASGIALDLRTPGFHPDGRHWLAEPHLFQVAARDVGQVFGVAIDDAPAPNIYLTATALFGLHRNSDNSGWMDGMWGRAGGPGTVYRLDAANNYRPEVFAQTTLDGRPNSGASLGNIAFDRWNRQLYVSDLETGMIHRIAMDGSDLGHFDHGVSGRSNFFDAAAGGFAALAPVPFETAGAARIFDCPTGDFSRTTSCWNLADFRRRVFGLGVRRDGATGEVRLYYTVWSSQGFGNPAWATAGDEQKNTLWSVAIGPDGNFDPAGVRREAVLPDFFVAPEDILRAGYSHPVADIAFPEIGDQSVMLLAERGGLRNLGLAATNGFATPHEARVLRYEIDARGVWQPIGRYDVGFYDRKDQSPPYIRANAAGGAAFGFGYDANGLLDPTSPDAFVWMTGDALCSPGGPCFNPSAATHDDTAQVHGIDGQSQATYEPVVPDAAFRPYPAPGPAYPATGPDSAYMIDTDINVDAAGVLDTAGLARNDATRIGDIAIYQAEPKRPDLEIVKRATSEQCEPEGECTFEMVVTNVGEVSYAGPLAVRDTIGAGGMLVDYTPMAPDGWDCQEVFSGTYECGLTDVTLAPGEATTLSMTVQVPAWWNQASYSNCVELTTPDATVDGRSYNNLSCGYVAICTPGTPGCDFDLALTKFGVDGQCDWLGNCLYVTRITNVGAAEYNGPLAFHDRIAQPGAALADFAPRPDWICGPGGTTEFDCILPAVTLAPGEFRDVSLWIAGPPLADGFTHVRNCAGIDWRGAPRDANPYNEYDCSEVYRYPPGHPSAEVSFGIDKDPWYLTCHQEVPLGSWKCEYDVTIVNTGGAPYHGPFEISDEMTGPGPFQLAEVSPPWTCDPGVGSPGPHTCTRPSVPGGLLPGDKTGLRMVIEVGATVPEGSAHENCATLWQDIDGDGIAEAEQSCAVTFICSPGSAACPEDMGIVKDGQPSPCYPGFPCEFFIGFANLSSDPTPVIPSFVDSPESGVGFPTIHDPPGMVCVAIAGENDFSCSFPGPLPPNFGVGVYLSFEIPDDYSRSTFRNCVRIPSMAGNDISDNDDDCAYVFVPFADLDISGGTECYRDKECTLDVNITNRGKLRFVGAVGATGSIAPAVPIESITSLTPGLTCRVTDVGAYECRSDRLDLAPEASAEWQVKVVFGLDYPAEEATHTKNIFWPDRDVQDIKPENDEDVSTITILGPKEPVQPVPEQVVTPQPEPAPAPTPIPELAPVQPRLLPSDLAVYKTADQATCVIGRPCRFTVKLLNVGSGPYIAPVRFSDRITQATARLIASGPSPWRCTMIGDTVSCEHETTTLNPNQSLELNLTLMPTATTGGNLVNCGQVEWVITGRVAMLQHALNQLGFPAGPIDGKMGPRTRAAIIDYEGANALPQTGEYSDALMQSIFGTWAVGDALATNDQSCTTVVVRRPLTPPIPPSEPPAQPVITCVGGTIQGDKCVCPAGTASEQFGTSSWRCVATTPALITCTGGEVVNNQCVCPEGTFSRQTATNSWRCVPETTPGVVPGIIQQLTCQGGSVQRGQCICPKGTEREQILPNVYRCEPSAPSIQCGGGRIESNECICPEGMEAQLRATNVYKCVPTSQELPSITPSAPPAAAPSITCTGGNVQNGNCVCPIGTRRESTGTNAYRCVPIIRSPLPGLIPKLFQR